MTAKVHTGDGDEYTPGEIDEFEDAILEGFEDFGLDDDSDVPDGVDVDASIEWAGVVSARDGGRRRTVLDRLPLRPVQAAAREARAAQQAAADAQQAAADARQAADSAQPYKSYSAKGWRAQYGKIASLSRGGEAAAAAGLSVTPKTIRAWERGIRQPSPANQAKIADAYRWLAETPVRAAESRASEAQTRAGEAQTRAAETTGRVADAMTDAIESRYGVTVRFRNIVRWTFRRGRG
jgi:transcriptional regulator with XRE-family HTH domain